MGCSQAGSVKTGETEEICLNDSHAESVRTAANPRTAQPARPAQSPAQPAQATKGLEPGANVRVVGLKGDGALRLNGEAAVLDSWNAATNRWNVRLRSGEVKAIRPENLEEVVGLRAPVKAPVPLKEELGEDPPLLEVWSRHREGSERAQAAQKLLEAPLKKLDLSVPPELLQQAKRRPDVDSEPDTKLLSSGDDERVVLDDLDLDLQLRSSMSATARKAPR
ncbi:unnamed protein product [Effrenium voratum]|uniref:Uncharacterized protein n=1 Tax=Effrenium voratum TaxID=2562239 RepID=A0AA36NMW8_9DINO|nr:unnamed protein product [Effrenium voratum]CAJ1439052.1 unnamed protein product [Effrenium voratum]